MVEVRVPKNIMIYESKTIGPFTTKQFVCLIIAVGIDFLLYNLILKPMEVSPEVLFYTIAFADVPILAIGYYKPMGISLGKYLKMIYNTVILAPAKRLNKLEMIPKPESQKKEKTKKSKTLKAYK